MRLFIPYPQTCSYRKFAAKAYRLFFVILFLSIAQFGFSQPPAPQFKSFQPVPVGKSHQSPSSFQSNAGNSLMPNDPYAQQNSRMMQQAAMNMAQTQGNRQQQLSSEQYLSEDKRAEMEYMWEDRSKIYQQNFGQLLQLNANDFSITKAVYLTESAWYDDPPPFKVFEKAVKLYAEAVKQLLQKEGLSASNNTAINYGIQKLYRQNNTFFDKQTGKTHTLPKLGYDFRDYRGQKQWSNMFVDKLLRTGNGQCHSLPLLYLCIIEQLNGKAYLSLSPNHSFIQYFDGRGTRYNFETTNGNHITQAWLMQSAFVNSIALANKTYLDTLSKKQLYAQILADLFLGYVDKLGYDGTAETIMQKIQEADPNNMTALLIQANMASYEFSRKLNESGNPTPDQLSNYPALQEVYNKRNTAYRKIDATGYQDMPPEVYQQWLKSMQREEQKQQDKEEYDKLLKELKKLKHIKPAFKNSPKK